jgi:adenine-specific DNA-methyltransferase
MTTATTYYNENDRWQDVLSGSARWAVVYSEALALLDSLPESSVNLCAIDPPYYRVKDEAWDRAWDHPAAFVAWIGELCQRIRRVLAPNGSLYLFASPQMSARVEVEVSRWFNVLNRITWAKAEGRHKGSEKETLRGYFPATESIIFAEQFGADSAAKGEAGYVSACDKARGFVFEPIRAYLNGERRRAGLSPEDCNRACGTASMARHYFTSSQWILPTNRHYTTLQTFFNRDGRRPAPPWEEFHDAPRERFERHATTQDEYLRADYESLRADYESLRADYESLRRPFFATPKRPYTDVWTFATVANRPGKHLCEKPLDMARHIVETSSRPGDLVLDCFAGSGVMGEAALNLGRRVILGEIDPQWVDASARRCIVASGDLSRSWVPIRTKALSAAVLARGVLL